MLVTLIIIDIRKLFCRDTYVYCTLRGRDQRLKCAIISIFYGAVLYLPNFRKIQHTWANIALLAKTHFRRYLAYPAIK